MKALILNSGMGTRMGPQSERRPKCMTRLPDGNTLLSRQLRQIAGAGLRDVVITTGFFHDDIIAHCRSLSLPLSYAFVRNPAYAETNYIYSIYLAREQLDDDLLLLHGDLVLDDRVLGRMLGQPGSHMAVSSVSPLPEKDFKAVITDGRITAVGVGFFEGAVAAQPLYKLQREDWQHWLRAIRGFCEANRTRCYAEDALNEVSSLCRLTPLDVYDLLCNEIDSPEDLRMVSDKMRAEKSVYMCFSTDMVHSGHIAIIKKAAALGRLTVGILSDSAVASYKRFPLIPFEERKALFENISGVACVVEQRELSYRSVLTERKPDYVVHGDDWREGFQKAIRQEVIETLNTYGGELVEFPYAADDKYAAIERHARDCLAVPDMRRGRLRKLLALKPILSILEAHSGITGLIAEKTTVLKEGKTYQFDGMWVSSLCDSTAKGKPDIELVDMSSRMQTIHDIMEVTTKPVILDGDTGGLPEHFVYNVKTLERMGVSAIVIEDKTGLKKNSLFGTDVPQTQDSIENFSAKIMAGKRAQKTREFMIIARIESLILERGMDDALRRAFAYVEAGADGILIHSRSREPDEIFAFMKAFRAREQAVPVAVVPTSFTGVTEEELAAHGVNLVIYANQLTRSGFPAMKKVAETLLENRRAREADSLCMSIREILTLIPEDE